MGSLVTPTKSLKLHQELLSLKSKSTKIYALKTLIALSALILGVVAIVFLNIQFASFAIGLIILSAAALYHLAHQHRSTNRSLKKAAATILFYEKKISIP